MKGRLESGIDSMSKSGTAEFRGVVSTVVCCKEISFVVVALIYHVISRLPHSPTLGFKK